MNKVVTISRQYASGGREVAEKLAKEYGVPFYDRALIAKAAKESGFAEAAFDNVEMKATNSLLYSIAMGMNAYGSPDLGYTHLSLDDRIYIAQSDIIRKVADEGPCIIVGRCADYVLRERKDVQWTYISPAADFQAEGERSGKYILAGEEFTLNPAGESVISYADYAIAMVDEIESGKHIQERISVVRA